MSDRWRLQGALGVLAVLAAGLWLQDTHWIGNWEDAVPALAALPLFWWLGRPWRLRAAARPFPAAASAVCAAAFAFGAASQVLLVAAAGWTGLLGCVLHTHCESDSRRPWTRLLPLAVLGFPWLAFHSPWLGWWFRCTGASAAEAALTALQLDVCREGTQLWTAGLRITVGESCSGLRGLQAMLIGGTVMASGLLPPSRGYWWHLPLLAAGAWLANTLRILVTALGARLLPLSWIEGDAHLWQGWLLLCLMFFVCLAALRRLGRWQEQTAT